MIESMHLQLPVRIESLFLLFCNSLSPENGETAALSASYTACAATEVGYANVTVPLTCPNGQKENRVFVRPVLAECGCLNKIFQQR